MKYEFEALLLMNRPLYCLFLHTAWSFGEVSILLHSSLILEFVLSHYAFLVTKLSRARHQDSTAQRIKTG